MEQARPGDIILVNNGKQYNHTAIAGFKTVRSNELIHCTPPRCTEAIYHNSNASYRIFRPDFEGVDLEETGREVAQFALYLIEPGLIEYGGLCKILMNIHRSCFQSFPEVYENIKPMLPLYHQFKSSKAVDPELLQRAFYCTEFTYLLWQIVICAKYSSLLAYQLLPVIPHFCWPNTVTELRNWKEVIAKKLLL
jgi:hypothetical protein